MKDVKVLAVVFAGVAVYHAADAGWRRRKLIVAAVVGRPVMYRLAVEYGTLMVRKSGAVIQECSFIGNHTAMRLGA